jgi:hypothetical protein
VPYEKMVLHPLNPWAILHDPSVVVDALRGVGLVGASFSRDGEVHFQAGPRVRELVLFRRGAFAEGSDLHVSLLETTEEPLFLGASNALSPRCPVCHSVFAGWRAHLQAWQRDKRHGLWPCAKCRKGVEVHRLDWMRTGGIARYALDVWGVRENAAVPSPELLATLTRVTFQAWGYFYYRLGTGNPGRAHSTLQPH